VLRRILDKFAPLFEGKGKFSFLYPLWEAGDTFLYTPKHLTDGKVHVRDAIDFKRMMMTVVVALFPCVFMAMYNVGLQANSAIVAMGLSGADGWRGVLLQQWGIECDPKNFWACFVHGGLYFLPAYAVCMAVGGTWDVVFALVRQHEVNEGFFVTGLLFPLTLPPAIPLWQVALGISFGVVIGKEIFGGTGRNFLNPALTARAFLFFNNAEDISGDAVWTAVDGFSGATPLGMVAADGMEAVEKSVTLSQCYIGTIQGSMGETSVIACLIGAAFLILSGMGSWRIMLSMLMGAMAMSTLLYVCSVNEWTSNPAFEMPPHWHLAVGGLAFGLVFMATDPVSAAMTNVGQWIYGILIGVTVLLVRVVNPAFPEGTMLAILLGNVFAPLIDYYVVRANIRRRALRSA